MAETKKAPEKPKKRGKERKKEKIINISENVYIKKKERKTGVFTSYYQHFVHLVNKYKDSECLKTFYTKLVNGFYNSIAGRTLSSARL